MSKKYKYLYFLTSLKTCFFYGSTCILTIGIRYNHVVRIRDPLHKEYRRLDCKNPMSLVTLDLRRSFSRAALAFFREVVHPCRALRLRTASLEPLYTKYFLYLAQGPHWCKGQ